MFKHVFLAACSLFLVASAMGNDEVSSVKPFSDWCVSKRCSIEEKCNVFTLALPPTSGSVGFSILFHSINDFEIFIGSIGLSDKDLSTWDRDSDRIRVKVRIDNQPYVETILNRKLYRKNKILNAFFPTNKFGKKFIKNLKQGTVLKVRYYPTNSEPFTVKFSLKGATAAFNYANQHLIKKK